MRPVLQRIAIYGTLAALFLGVLGVILGQMAAMMLPQSADVPVAVAEGQSNPDDETLAMIQKRTPIMMAIWGFAFVAVGEVILHFWRSRRPAPPSPTQAERNETERIMQELLAKAEAEEKEKANPDTGRHRLKGGESQEIMLPEIPRPKDPPKS